MFPLSRNPFSLCEKNYSQGGDLHRHMKVAHGTLGVNQLKMAKAKAVKLAASQEGKLVVSGDAVSRDAVSGDAVSRDAVQPADKLGDAYSNSEPVFQGQPVKTKNDLKSTRDILTVQMNRDYELHSDLHTADSVDHSFGDISLSFIEINDQQTYSTTSRIDDRIVELNRQLVSLPLQPVIQRAIGIDPSI